MVDLKAKKVYRSIEENKVPSYAKKLRDSYLNGYFNRLAPTHLKPQFFPLAGKKGFGEIGKPLIGVELEFNVSRETDVHTAILENLILQESQVTFSKFVNLRYEHGERLEMVSAPVSLSVHRKLWAEEFFDKGFGDKYLRGGISCNTGMHVHIDKSALSVNQLRKFLHFFNWYKNSRFISYLSGRDVRDHDFCNQCEDYTYEETSCYTKSTEQGDKDYITNLSHFGTCEIRCFLTPTNKQDMFRNIEFVEAVYCFIKGQEDTSEIKTDLESFLNWIPIKRYPHLASDLSVVDYFKYKDLSHGHFSKYLSSQGREIMSSAGYD